MKPILVGEGTDYISVSITSEDYVVIVSFPAYICRSSLELLVTISLLCVRPQIPLGITHQYLLAFQPYLVTSSPTLIGLSSVKCAQPDWLFVVTKCMYVTLLHPLGTNITGVDTTQPGPLISTWIEFWNAISGMLLIHSNCCKSLASMTMCVSSWIQLV